MGIEKKQVFLVTGRRPGGEATLAAIEHCVVCGVDSDSVRILMSQVAPDVEIVSVVGLLQFEDTAKKIKAVLAGEDTSWAVFVDPALQALKAA